MELRTLFGGGQLRERGTRAMRLAAAALGLGALLASIAVVGPFSADSASALSGSDFKPDLIISNEVMYYKGAMSANSIQNFLNAKVSTCVSGHTCLKDYATATTDKAADAYCNGYVGKSSETAAQIIYRAAQSCGVNPQVLLVLLQKEQSLVTSTTPTSLTYRKATGYGCPDTSSCISTYYGFFNQVWLAAKSFQRTPTGRYAVGVATTVQYNPNTSCGVRYLTIKNKATARLYVYTPYTPDKAALANLYGTGDSCSTYGNRNFWRLFNDWFGSSVIPAPSLAYVHAVYTDVLARDTTASELYHKSRGLTKSSARASLARSLFSSTAYRTSFVSGLYTSVLGHDGDPANVATWVKRLKSGAVSQDSLPAKFMGLTQYYTAVGGTREAYVGAIYQLILHRDPSDAELAAGVSRTKTHGRYSFALGLWRGTEHNSARVAAAYTLYLGRDASPAEQAAGASSITKVGYYKYLASILASSEYLTAAGARFPFTG